MTDEQIREYMKDKVSRFDIENDVPDDTAAEELGPIENGLSNSSNSREIAFLKNVVDTPGSGVAARYRRLGLSGRRGQKLKNRLLERGMIEEQLGTTPAGRLMSIRLTEQGKKRLSNERI